MVVAEVVLPSDSSIRKEEDEKLEKDQGLKEEELESMLLLLLLLLNFLCHPSPLLSDSGHFTGHKPRS